MKDKEKFATTIGLYVLGEISLGKAAERTSVTRWEMEEILQDASVEMDASVEIRLGPQTKDDLDDEVDVAIDIE